MELNQMQYQQATPPSNLPSALDQEVLDGLRALAADGVDIIGELTDAFVQDGSDRLRKMHEAVASGDAIAVRRAAHSLKGMSGSIGANHLSALTCELEVAEPGTLTTARIQILEQEFQRVVAALKA
jgi:HPt (histidine-containing phosphotransfer) domain-containing protein